MYIPFEELPEDARVWIYQANRNLTETEKRKIEDVLTSFVSGWKAHGAELSASFKIAYQRFIVIAVDTNTNLPSGCSIDSSVAVLKEIEKAFAIDLFNRTDIPFLEEGGTVRTVPLIEIKRMIVEGKIHRNSMTFNNLVESKDGLDESWLVTAGESWLKRFFDQVERVS
jgi:hypothetical protein